MRRFSPTRQIRRCRNIRRSTDRLREECDITFGRGISARLRSVVPNDDDLYCQMCGVIPGDIDDLTGRKVKFHIERIKAKKLGGEDELSNLRVLCSTCYRGAKELYKERTSDTWAPSHVGRERQHAQRPMLSALLKEIGGGKISFGHIVDKSIGGKEELSNLRTLCSTCNQGAKNITTEKPTKIWLLSQVRRAGQEEQRAVLKWLGEKFKD